MPVGGLLKDLCRILNSIEANFPRKTGFSLPDVFAVLYYISRDSSLGRITLSRRLSIGEMSVRSIFKFLAEHGILFTQGSLKKIHENYLDALKNIEFREIAKLPPIGWDRVYILEACVENAEKLASKTIELRDSAVRWGAMGAIVFLSLKDKKIIAPGITSYSLLKQLERTVLLNRTLECEGIIVLVGLEKDAIEWFPAYGLIRKICELQYSL
jgi:hypothetical protein